MEQTYDEDLGSSVNLIIVTMFVLVIALFGGAVAWANYFTISGAVIASGTVVVESNVKHIQHQDGGIVKTVDVANGDVVKAGDVLLRLDDTSIGASLAIAQSRLDDLTGQEARLIAERNRDENILFSSSSEQLSPSDSQAKFREGQLKLFESRKNRIANEKLQLAEQISQLDNAIIGYEAQLNARKAQLELASEELKNIRELFRENLVPATRVSTLEREVLQVQADIGELKSKIAQQRQAIAERQIQLLQVDETFTTQVLEALSKVQTEISGLREELVVLNDRNERLYIKAPRGGIVHDLAVHTIGAIVAPGERVMSIVPSDDQLIIEARVDPTSINQLYVNQTANLRFASLDPRTTPEIAGEVKSISADLLLDQITGQHFYQIRIKIKPEELAKLGEQRIVPGMPVEAFITTQDRTVLSYLIKPIADQIAHSLRER
jgi:HlyD family secretion protein